jgi:hypothetical protein
VRIRFDVADRTASVLSVEDGAQLVHAERVRVS